MADARRLELQRSGRAAGRDARSLTPPPSGGGGGGGGGVTTRRTGLLPRHMISSTSGGNRRRRAARQAPQARRQQEVDPERLKELQPIELNLINAINSSARAYLLAKDIVLTWYQQHGPIRKREAREMVKVRMVATASSGLLRAWLTEARCFGSTGRVLSGQINVNHTSKFYDLWEELGWLKRPSN